MEKVHKNLVSEESAKALAKIQSTYSYKGVILVRMSDIHNIFDKLWNSIDGRKAAYK